MNVNELTKILQSLRRATTVVKIIPFAFALIILIGLLTLPFTDDTEPRMVDAFIYQSPLNILFLIILSYCLKLCVWHRIECLLPLLPLVSAIVDDNIAELSATAATVNYGMAVAIFTASLINAYFVFVKPNKRRRK